jgi:hypothetical protein
MGVLMKNEIDYKVGSWLKHRRLGYLAEITKVYTNIKGDKLYHIKTLNTGIFSGIGINLSKLLEHYKFDPVAQALYGKTVEELQKERQIEKAINLGTLYGTTTGRWSSEFGSWSKNAKNSGN